MGLYIGSCLLFDADVHVIMPVILEWLTIYGPKSLPICLCAVCAQAHNNHHSLLQKQQFVCHCYGHAHAAPLFLCVYTGPATDITTALSSHAHVTCSELTLQLLTTTALCFPTGRDSFTGRDLGGTVYRSGMCLLCYQEYLEVGGGQVQGHNPPAFTRGLIKTAKAAEVRADCLFLESGRDVT